MKNQKQVLKTGVLRYIKLKIVKQVSGDKERCYERVHTNLHGKWKGQNYRKSWVGCSGCRCGLQVFIVQFMKKGDYSEITALEKFQNITVEQYGAGKFVKGKPSESEKAACKKGYSRLCGILEAGKHDLIIAEEANVASMCGLLTEEELLHLADIKLNMLSWYLRGVAPRHL